MVRFRNELKACDPLLSSNNYEESPNMAFLGYLCVEGSCSGVVVATGEKTLIAKMIMKKEWPPKPC
jgi:magnesium-transporting ATPase (P-type)